MVEENKNRKALDFADPSESINISAGKTVCLVFAAVGAVFVLINLFVGNRMMAYINGALFLLMVVGYFTIRKSHSLKYAIPILFVTIIYVEINYLMTGGEDGFSILWILLIPPFAIYLLRLKQSVTVSLIVWLIAVIGLWSPLNAFCYDYSRTFEVRFPLLYAAEIAVSIMIKRKMSQVERRRDELLKLNIQYRDEAEQANQKKSRFLAGMSHEIRTPINAVLGMNEMILRESTQPDILEYAASVDSAGRYLLSLVNDILDISKIESGKMELVCADYSLSSLLDDVVQMAVTRADAKGIHIHVQIEKEIPDHLYGDRLKICQVLTNIMTNAVKYTGSGGMVTLTVSKETVDSEQIRLTMGVRDTGRGIKEEDLPKLFESFTRVDEEENQAIEGSGLGLAISQNYIEQMGGTMSVESEYGKGSHFQFAIPQKVVSSEVMCDLENPYRRETVGNEDGPAFTAPDAKLLVVDDSEMNRCVVRGLLKRTLVQIDTAGSGKECLSMLADDAYDVILLDHMMPEMDGIETLQQIRTRYPENGAKVIVLTANAVSGAKEQYLKSGFDDYLTKPIDGRVLESTLMKYLPAEKLAAAECGKPAGEKVQTGTERPAGTEKPADMEKPAGIEATDITGFTRTELEEWRQAVSELDIGLGMEYCMQDKAFYMEMLQMYADQSKLEDLNRYYEDNDLENYRICMHALKSTSQNIGLVNLAGKAKKLEEAAKRGDVSYIQGCHAAVMEQYRACRKGIEMRISSCGFA